MCQSHGDRTMTVRPSYDMSVFESAGVSVVCSILFDTFEVPSQLKICSCTCLVHECSKVHEDHTATVRSSQVLRTEAARAPCDIRAISMQGCGDSTMTARSTYDLRTVRSPHGLSTALHRSVVEIRQINRTMAV